MEPMCAQKIALRMTIIQTEDVSMAEKIGNDANLMPLGFDAMIEMQRPSLTAMAEVNTRLYESISAVNKEWVSFVNRRLKEDLAVPQQLAECKSISDLFRVYAQFFQNACTQYQAGFEQMTKLSSAIAEHALQPLQSGAESAARTKH
jgi:hypothetical protein